MQPENDDIQFEQYLRQFVPRPPAPLPVARRSSNRRNWLAAAAVVVVACGLAIWLIVRSGSLSPSTALRTRSQSTDTGISSTSLGRMSQFLAADPERLDAALTEASQEILPNVQRTDGALWALAQDLME
jgi:hypothetical protein